jgi:D-threo-aldose 1-dehydrogenase
MDATADRRPIGRGGLTVGRLGLGTAPIGGLFEAVGEDQAAATLEAAWDAGVRYFDTAPHYGAGLAERRLGAFLTPARRAEAVVSTKVGRLLRPGGTQVRDYSRDGVHRSVAGSLERTGLDAFDILFIHDPDDHWAEAVGEAYPALERLRDEGAVKAIGVGMNQTRMLSRFVAETDIDCVMVAGRYSLLDREAAHDLLPRCRERGVAVIVAGVFNSGVLADPRPGAHFDYAPAGDAVLARARAMARRCAAYGVPLGAAAVHYPLRHPGVTGVVVGARTPAEVSAATAAPPIPEALWAELEEL